MCHVGVLILANFSSQIVVPTAFEFPLAIQTRFVGAWRTEVGCLWLIAPAELKVQPIWFSVPSISTSPAGSHQWHLVTDFHHELFSFMNYFSEWPKVLCPKVGVVWMLRFWFKQTLNPEYGPNLLFLSPFVAEVLWVIADTSCSCVVWWFYLFLRQLGPASQQKAPPRKTWSVGYIPGKFLLMQYKNFLPYLTLWTYAKAI